MIVIDWKTRWGFERGNDLYPGVSQVQIWTQIIHILCTLFQTSVTTNMFGYLLMQAFLNPTPEWKGFHTYPFCKSALEHSKLPINTPFQYELTGDKKLCFCSDFGWSVRWSWTPHRSRVNTSLQPYSNNKRGISIPHWARYLPYWLQPMRGQYFPSKPITDQ